MHPSRQQHYPVHADVSGQRPARQTPHQLIIPSSRDAADALPSASSMSSSGHRGNTSKPNFDPAQGLYSLTLNDNSPLLTERGGPIPPNVVVHTPTSQTTSFASEAAMRRAPILYQAQGPNLNFSRPRLTPSPSTQRFQHAGHLSPIEASAMYEHPRPPPSPSNGPSRPGRSPSPSPVGSPFPSDPGHGYRTISPHNLQAVAPASSPSSIYPIVQSTISVARSLSPYSSTSSTSHSDRPRSPLSNSPSEEPYERYSYYELPSPLPSPDRQDSFHLPSPEEKQEPSQPARALSPNPDGIQRTAEDYLTLGITSHLLDSPSSLADSARYFHTSATINGGCGMGMLMWGLCLRHGWGVDRDEKQAFHWLRRACELALGDLEGLDTLVPEDHKKAKSKAEPAPLQFEKELKQEVKGELILAIYEVGQSFFQGWGVPRDRAMGFKYFHLAARLGDMDAQQELGYCYYNGKGTAKNRKEAAKWYRAAAAQGASTVGLAWIYKDKYK